jgi:hypothetical protein
MAKPDVAGARPDRLDDYNAMGLDDVDHEQRFGRMQMCSSRSLGEHTAARQPRVMTSRRMLIREEPSRLHTLSNGEIRPLLPRQVEGCS